MELKFVLCQVSKKNPYTFNIIIWINGFRKYINIKPWYWQKITVNYLFVQLIISAELMIFVSPRLANNAATLLIAEPRLSICFTSFAGLPVFGPDKSLPCKINESVGSKPLHRNRCDNQTHATGGKIVTRFIYPAHPRCCPAARFCWKSWKFEEDVFHAFATRHVPRAVANDNDAILRAKSSRGNYSSVLAGPFFPTAAKHNGGHRTPGAIVSKRALFNREKRWRDRLVASAKNRDSLGYIPRIPPSRISHVFLSQVRRST